MPGLFRRSRLFLCGAAALVCAAFPRASSAQVQPLIVSISPLTNTVSWNAVVDPSTTALVTYSIYRSVGLFGSNPLGNPAVVTGYPFTSYSFGGRMSVSECFVVVANDAASGAFETSASYCHSFLHNTGGGNNDGILRADGSGTQLGINQAWNFGYYLDADAYVTLKVYPPGTTFNTAPNAFVTPAPGSVPTKTVADAVPRSAEMNTAPFFENVDFWDSRNSSGTTVTNGIYTAAMSAYLPSGTTVYANTFTIPVDIIRFVTFNTAGISATSALANISYTITANSTVRIVVAKPGRQFTIDANGLVQSLDATGTVVDTSTNSVVRVLTFNRSGSATPYTETWDGTNSFGVAVGTGVYAVGLSALDGYGNRALNLSGNNGPVQGTISVDKTPSLSAPNATPPTVNTVSVGGTGINLISGGTAVGSFSSIVFTISATAGSGSALTLTGPGGLAVPGAITASANTITFSTTAVISATGTYTLAGTVQDSNGNTSNVNYNFILSAAGAGSGAPQTNAAFSTGVIPYPNPVRTPPAKIDFVLTAASTVDVDIYTLTGRRILHQESSYAAGTQTFSWGLSNDSGAPIANGIYFVRVTATNPSGTVHAFKKIMVVK